MLSKIFHNSTHSSSSSEGGLPSSASVRNGSSSSRAQPDYFVSVTPRQFGQRLVPAHLENSSIQGQDCLNSVHYWLGIIALQLEEKYYLDHQIKKAHLEELHALLLDYSHMLTIYRNGNKREVIQTILQKTQEKLTTGRRVAYIPLSYTTGPRNNGHRLSLKVQKHGDKVAVLILNLGEGTWMHPKLTEKRGQTHYHFQSFPIHFDPEKFFGTVGEEIFSRQLKLHESPDFKEAPYSAEDCYAPFWEYGIVQSSFASAPLDRAEPPHIGPTCADTAILLIIKDILIDLGYDTRTYDRPTINRFLINEKLTALISFKKTLEKNGSYDHWCLLKKGLEEFSIHTLQTSSSILHEKELMLCQQICEPLFAIVEKRIHQLKPSQKFVSVAPIYINSTEFKQKEIPRFSYMDGATALIETEKNFKFQAIDAPCISSAKNFSSSLINSLEQLKALLAVGDKERASRFVYHTLLVLPIPDAVEKDYWDQIPYKDISPILNHMLAFIHKGLCWKDQNARHTNVITLHTAYAIVDKLARRMPEMRLQGYASPFFPSQIQAERERESQAILPTPPRKGQGHCFEFHQLPLGSINTRWIAIRRYFESQADAHSHTPTLFALSQSFPNLSSGVRALQKGEISTIHAPVAEHLSYLQQFLSKKARINNFRVLLQHSETLWLNKDQNTLPPAFEPLYYFAFYAWISVSSTFLQPPFPKGIVQRTRIPQQKSCDVILKFFKKNTKEPPCFQLGSANQFLHDVQGACENQAMCLRGDTTALKSTKNVQEWARIFANPELRISTIFQWIRLNLHKLNNPHIQKLIEYGLFEPGFLQKKIDNEPTVLPLFSSLINEAIESYQRRGNRQTTLFCIRIAICLETFKSNPDRAFLGMLETHLLKMIDETSEPNQEYHHLLLLYRIALPKQKKSARELVKGQVYLTYSQWEPPTDFPMWILAENSYLLNLYQKEMRIYQRDMTWGLETARQALARIIPDLPNAPYPSTVAAYPHIQYGAYTLNIENSTLTRNKRETLVVIEPNPCFDSLGWSDGERLLSTDGQFMLKKSERSASYELWKKIALEGMGTHWYCKTKANKEKLHSIFQGEVWLADEKCTAGYAIIDNRCVVAATSNSNWRVYQLRNGQPTGRVLANINKSQFPYLSSPGIEREICCWTNPKTLQVEEIEWLGGNLSFVLEEIDDALGKNVRYRCTQYPEYTLSEVQTLEVLNHFPDNFVLQADSKICVVIPAKELFSSSQDFSPQVYMFPSWNLDSKTPFFFYTIDEYAELLISSDPTANLYLTLLFAKQRDYVKAMHYLACAHSFEKKYPSQTAGGREIDLKLIEAFYSLNDRSPEALAFYLHLGLYYIENMTQLIHEHYEAEQPPTHSIYFWIAEIYEQYIPALSSHAISAVPTHCRLSQKQELFLLRQLKPILQAQDRCNKKTDKAFYSSTPNWRDSFNVRQQLLKTEKPLTGCVSKCHYATQLFQYRIFPVIDIKSALTGYNPIFTRTDAHQPGEQFVQRSGKKCGLKEDFVRISLEDIQKHFIELYERALSGKGVLDVLYIVRSTHDSSNPPMLAYAALLYHIRQYPNSFYEFNFTTCSNKNDNIFQQIVKQVSLIQEKICSSKTTCTALFKKTVHFKHQNTTTLQLPPSTPLEPVSWQFSTDQIKELKTFERDLCIDFPFQEKRAATLSEDQPFVFTSYSPSTPSEAKLVAAFREGYQTLKDPQSGHIVYTSKKKYSQYVAQILVKLTEKQEALQQLKADTEKCANYYPQTAYRIGLRQRGRDLPRITIEGILTDAYEHRDPMRIRRANPSLPPRTIHHLLFNTIKYHLLRIQILQLEKALDSTDIQSLGESLAVHLTVSPVDNPEIYLFQSRSGKILWPNQVHLLEWYFKTAQRNPITLFAGAAGVGKTTVFQPIAMKWLQQKKFFPVSVSPRSLYAVDREGLRHATQHLYGLQTAVFELALNTETNGADFQRIFKKLLEYRPFKGLKITPEVYLSLLLKYELALEAEDVESVHWISRTLDLLETKAAGLIDEGRLNASPFTQAEIGIGKPIPLPLVDRKVFIEIYRALTTGALRETVKLQANLQAVMCKSAYPTVKQEACRMLVNCDCFQIPDDQKQATLSYWIDGGDQPAWLTPYAGTARVRAIDLVKIYFDEFFSSAMSCVGKMNHRRSPKPNEEIHVPARKRHVTHAYFKEVYATLITTIQGTLQDGLDKEQALALLKRLKEAHLEEVGHHSDAISKSEQDLRRWCGGNTMRLTHFTHSKQGTIERFYALVKHNPEAILYYLEYKILNQITYCPEQLIVNPIHFLNAFKKTTVFSADPGPNEIYGLHGATNCVRTDSAFLTQVVQQLACAQNSDICVFPTITRPLALYEWIFNNKRELFSDMSMLADIGGGLRDFSPDEIAADYFQFLKMHKEIKCDGIILFDESSGAETSKQLLYMEGEEPKILKGNDIVKALDAYGLKWKELNLLTLIDPSHGTGANVKQPPQARALLLLGEELTLGDLIQGVMRLRDFLKSQRITWGLSKPLSQKISQIIPGEQNALAFLQWALINEGKRIDKEVLLSAFQQITYHIEAEARGELKKHLKSPLDQIKIWKKYRNGFVTAHQWDPVERFKGGVKEEQVETVLSQFAKTLHSRFGYQTELSKLSPKLKPITQTVKKRKSTLCTRESLEISRQTHTYTYQQQQTEHDQVSATHQDLTAVAPTPLPDELTIDQANFVDNLQQYAKQNRELFCSKYLTANVWISNNLINTAQSGTEMLGIKYIKPAQYILLVNEGSNRFYAFALSDEEACFFQRQLVSTHLSDNSLTPPPHLTIEQRKVALLNCDGTFAQNGKGAYAFSSDVLSSPFVKNCVTDIGLIRCELFNFKCFMDRIEEWKDFWSMWSKIKAGQPVPQEACPGPIERLIPEWIKISQR